MSLQFFIPAPPGVVINHFFWEIWHFLGFSKACAFKIKMFQTVVTFLLLLPVRNIDAAGLKERNQITCTQVMIIYISPVVSPFYGKEYGLWAGFGPVGSNENCPN